MATRMPGAAAANLAHLKTGAYPAPVALAMPVEDIASRSNCPSLSPVAVRMARITDGSRVIKTAEQNGTSRKRLCFAEPT